MKDFDFIQLDSFFFYHHHYKWKLSLNGFTTRLVIPPNSKYFWVKYSTVTLAMFYSRPKVPHPIPKLTRSFLWFILHRSSTNGDIFLAPPHSQLLQQQHLSHSTLPEIRRSRRGRGRSKGSKGTHTAGELNYAHSLPDPIVDVSKIVYNPRYAMYKNGTGDLYY